MSTSPFAYPDHGYIPFSIEKICTKVPLVKPEDRENTGLIYAKKSSASVETSWRPLTCRLLLG